MSSCSCCKIKNLLKENNLLSSVKITTNGKQVTITATHECEASDKKEEKKQAPKEQASGEASPKQAPKKEPEQKSPAANPADAEKKPKPKKEKEPVVADAKPKVASPKLTPAPPPVAPKARNSYRVSIVFPKLRRTQDFFTKAKPAIFFALKRSVAVEMQDADGAEAEVWCSVHPDNHPQQLLAVRINPLPWENPTDGASQFEQLLQIFKECQRKVIVDMESRQVFVPPNTLPGKETKSEEKPREYRRQRNKAGVGAGAGAGAGKPATADSSAKDKVCSYCQQAGHFNRNCPKRLAESAAKADKEVSCFNCGQVGHVVRNCPTAKDSGAYESKPSDNRVVILAKRGCYNCGDPNHIARNCPSAPEKTDHREGAASSEKKPLTCYYCKEEGHISRDCPAKKQDYAAEGGTRRNQSSGGTRRGGEGGRGRGRGGNSGCYNCGGDHYARDCPNAPKAE